MNTRQTVLQAKFRDIRVTVSFVVASILEAVPSLACFHMFLSIFRLVIYSVRKIKKFGRFQMTFRCVYVGEFL